MPTFSVVIPSYNRAYILGRAIDSIRAQNVTHWECLIVDDGSTDNTAEVIAAYNDPRIRHIRQPNGGAFAARNTGMHAATGDVVVYLDSDDIFYPGYFEALSATKAGFGICHHRRSLVFLNPDGSVRIEKEDPNNVTSMVTLQDFYDWRIKTTSSGLFHRKGVGALWRDVLIEDLDFILQLAESYPDDFVYIPQTFVYYRHTYGGDGLCAGATFQDYSKAFGQIYKWHQHDRLMKNPDVYLGRVKNYAEKQIRADAGLEPPHHYKYFPELWTGTT